VFEDDIIRDNGLAIFSEGADRSPDLTGATLCGNDFDLADMSGKAAVTGVPCPASVLTPPED
jgi:hypothetical protein